MKKRFNEFTHLLKVCRQTWSRSNMQRRLCLQAANVLPDHKLGNHLPKWRCAACMELFAKSDVQVDHRDPVAKSAPKNLEEVLECLTKLYCNLENLQVLCLTCHKSKTKLEISERKKLELIENIMEFMQIELISGPVNLSGTIPGKTELKKLEALMKRIKKVDGALKEKLMSKFSKLTLGFF